MRKSSEDQAEGNDSAQIALELQSAKLHSFDDSCLGPDRQELRGAPVSRSMEPLLQPTAYHTICVMVDDVYKGNVKPFSTPNAEGIWSADHVKMPFSNLNIQTKKKSGMRPHEVKVKRWNIIKEALKKPTFTTPKDVENTIKQYNQKYAYVWTFTGLCQHLDQLPSAERQHLLATLLPDMAKLALRLPDLCSKPIRLLKRGREHAITMSQEQIACLLANAFFCTFPRRNSTEHNSEYCNFPNINFSRLLENFTQRTSQKLKTIFCYFSTVTGNMPKGLVTFQRCCLNDSIRWNSSTCRVTKLHVTSKGSIEEEQGMLQVDFAAALVGGGVLGSGLVQEEIRFLINTELIVARLFTEKLQDNECLVITGAQRYSEYNGYSDSFRWTRCHNDETPRDSWLRRSTEIVAIDAINFRHPMDQYDPYFLQREITKAYCGFSCRVLPASHHSAVATGNWGCGAYKGDVKLKALLQIMAAAQARRDVVYFTFGDRALVRSIYEMHRFLQRKDVTVGQLYNILEKYSRINFGASSARDLYEFIQNNVDCLKVRF